MARLQSEVLEGGFCLISKGGFRYPRYWIIHFGCYLSVVGKGHVQLLPGGGGSVDLICGVGLLCKVIDILDDFHIRRIWTFVRIGGGFVWQKSRFA